MSKRFHASPKGMLAVLACLALLCSLFAFSLTVLADPAGDYTPSRYLKLTNTTDSEPMFILKTPAEQYLEENGPYTLSLMLKAENLKGIKGDASGDENPDQVPDVQVMNGWADLEATIKADTDGYVKCEYEIAKPTELEFAFLWTAGSLYIADLVVTDKNDKVMYSLNWDDTLFGMETFTSTATWSSALYNTGKEEIPAGATFEIFDDLDPATYAPTRYLKMSNPGNAQPCLQVMMPGEQFPKVNAPYTISVKYKLENTASTNDGEPNLEVRNGWDEIETELGAATDGYVMRQYTVEEAGDALRIGFLYTSGDLYIADLVIRDKNGVIRYGLNSDVTLNGMTAFEDTTTIVKFIHGTGSQDVTFSAYTAEEHDINRDSSVVTVLPEPEEPPVLPDFDPGEDPVDTGDINRSITIVSSNMQTSTMTLSFFRDDAKIPDGFYVDPTSEEGPYALNSEDGPFYLVGKMKLTGFEGEKALISVKGAEKIALTADTDGWVDIKDADGNYLSLDMSNVEFMDGIAVALSSANGEFAIADLRIVDKDNNIVYSLANDTYLYGLSDLTKVKTQYKAFIDDDFNDAGLGYAGWKFDGKGKFNVLTKNDEYVPNKVLTMIVDEEHKAENPAIIFCNAYAPELFENGPYTITGKLRVDRMDRMDAAKTPTVGMDGKNYNVTNGWISFADVLGETPSFSHNSGAHWALISYYAYATVSVADVVIYDKDGEKVFDMATMEDEDGYYKSGSTLGGGYISLASYMGSRQQYLLLSNPEPVEHTTADYTVPVFEETGIEGGVPTPGPDTSDPDTSDKDSSTTPGGPDTGAETPILFCVVLGAAALGMALIVSKKKVRG